MAKSSRCGRNSAMIAAGLIIFNTLFTIIAIIASPRTQDANSPCGPEHHRFEGYIDAVANGTGEADQCLKWMWQMRRQREGVMIFSFIINSLSSACFVPAILDLSELPGSSTKNTVMVPAFCLFTAINIFEFITNMGFTTLTNWMGTRWNGNLEFLRMLEVAYWVVQSSWVWLFAMDFLFLSAGMFSLYSALGDSLKAYNSKCFQRLTVTIGVLSIFHFIFELARFSNWMVGSILGGLTIAIIGFFLMPCWFILLGRILASKAEGADALMDGNAREASGTNGMELGDGKTGAYGSTQE